MVYEIKSQSEAEWKPIRESPLWGRYRYQISVYMHATKLPLVVVRVKRDKNGGISDEAREEFRVPPVDMSEIRARVFQVEMMARRDLSEDVCEKIEFPCPFWYTHVKGEVDEREKVDDPQAVVLAGQYQAARRLASTANGRVQASRRALLAYMGDRRRLGLSDGTMLTRYQVEAKHVEYDRDGYWALRVTTKGKSEEGRDSL
jgi:hypothetical protein